MARPRMTRRAFLSGVASLYACHVAAAEEFEQTGTTSERIAVLDWGLAATLLALRIVPVGVPAVAYYMRNVVTPAMPEGVVDVGLLFTPNYELLYELRADRILIPPELEVARPQLERICTVSSFALRDGTGFSLDAASTTTQGMATELRQSERAKALISSTSQSILQAKERLSSHAGRSILLIGFVDDRHVAIFARGSLYDDVLHRLGLVNAWRAPVGFSGRTIVGIERLAVFSDIDVIVITTGGRGVPKTTEGMRFWQALPFVIGQRVKEIASVYDQGGLPSISRFATLLSIALVEDHDRD